MSISNVEVRYILKSYYKKGKNAAQAPKTNYGFYRPNAVSIRVAQNLFKYFQSDDFHVKGELRCNQAVTDKVDVLLEKVDQDRYISSDDIVEVLGTDHKTICPLRKKLDIQKISMLVSHTCSLKQI
ncbi:hypothetical protein EVAR_53632_1 [Eumeta japonica]|uniref:Histone-lysine N-methyltransferase SETMAR n=1 Tax=Eumeta variegata TaxID=151549 RepID=A0A4C1WYM1_EUMVA|nr:hypothetical protein EVAR_53632_1 [Eumeta japonica]